MNILDVDLAGVFSFTVSPLELMLRGTLMYWMLFVVLRFILRRDVGALGIGDFLFVVILGDAAQNSMIGRASSATDGMVLIGTLVFWSYMLDALSYQFRPYSASRPRRACAWCVMASCSARTCAGSSSPRRNSTPRCDWRVSRTLPP